MTIKYDKGSGIPDKWGDKIWRVNGQLHREDGPAVEYARGTKYWYLNGEQVYFPIRKTPTSGRTIEFNNGDIGIVLKHIKGIFWEILLGNEKKLAYCVDKT